MPINIKPDQPSNSPLSTPRRKNKNTEYWWNRDIQIFSKNISIGEKETFYSELSNLLKAGLDIQSSLELIWQSRKSSKLKDVIKKIEGFIVNGCKLSEALQNTNQFSDYEVYTINIGEETGKLSSVLIELSKFSHSSIIL